MVYVELLTGKRPFPGKNIRQLALQHMTEPPDLSMLPECDPVDAKGGVLTREYSSADITLDRAGLRALLAPYLTAPLPAELNA